jgi:D-glycero-alpha-D-manno-heptose 1-phosphate guanylyltransferase
MTLPTPPSRMPTAVILAGGLGTRLRTLVADVPKPMAPIGDRPFLAYLLDRLDQAGFERVILSVGYRADVIQAHFGAHHGRLELAYVHEREPLGTGGAIRAAMAVCGQRPVLALNGDTYLEIDYRRFVEFHRLQPAAPSLSLALRKVPDASRYGTATLVDDRIIGFAEKHVQGEGLINSGIYLVEPDAFDGVSLPERFSFESDFLTPHCARLRPRGFITDAYMIDIGTPEDFCRAQRELPARVARA